METEPLGLSNGLPLAPQGRPWPSYSGAFLMEQEDDAEQEEPSRAKRPRVTLACQRCKTSKKKCDGCQPCSKCKSSHAHCEYIVPQKPMPFGKNQYIKSLESRVAELETLLSTHGMTGLSNDHWKSASPSNNNYNNHVNSNNDPSIHWEMAQSEGKSTSSSLGPDVADPDAAVLDWQDGADSVVSVLRSLSLDVNGSGYIGASSQVAMGRLFTFLGRGRRHHDPVGSVDHSHGTATTTTTATATATASSFSSRPQSFPTGPSTPSSSLSSDTLQPIDFTDVPDQVAERLFGGYLKHIATRLPVIHTVWARDVHQRRHSLTDMFEITVLHLVYATAGRFIETTGESGMFHVKRHYMSAVQTLDTILEYNDIRTVQVLMLMAIYCLRDPIGPGAWTCSRIALLIVIEHGLHRQTKALSQLTLEGELRKRLFWACYAFDRQISIPMGRPFGISDRDIDLEFPLDIDEDITEERLACLPVETGSSPTTLRSTSLTPFLLITRLRQIESDIQQTIYRVDKSGGPVSECVTDEFLARLEQWKSMIPPDTHNLKDVGDVPYDGYDFYMIFYFKCQRLLLYPLISDPNVAPRFLKECARACAGVCGAYRRLHQTLPVGYSFMAVQTVFMAGLTLAYCIWISPDDIFDLTASNGIHDCSIVLFVIAERVHSAKKYRNAFEVIRQRLIDQKISSQTHASRRPREAVVGLTEELAPSVHTFDVNMPFEVDNGGYEQFSQIITDITGEDFFAGMNRFGAQVANPTGTPRPGPGLGTAPLHGMFNPVSFWTMEDGF
ncbi:hypothetical protein A1O1_03362 [Capronia coronata CBS 617.96]|uniref:Zn(2)-C6 fungal-type domain-containing protein n=1 Tax=Capronia coronata CBS 617.96 TaxID=1182541 RepID=W9YCK9_9EURO|nr:uncharacterized protein A1O1_03362 [Capronia coronata CBS 617.96]EXJ90263.1 hypothetical protein A1O1_03362 [Capronia coronata CBS 617.96]